MALWCGCRVSKEEAYIKSRPSKSETRGSATLAFQIRKLPRTGTPVLWIFKSKVAFSEVGLGAGRKPQDKDTHVYREQALRKITPKSHSKSKDNVKTTSQTT